MSVIGSAPWNLFQDCPISQWHSLRKRYLQLLRKIFFNSCIEFVSKFFLRLISVKECFHCQEKRCKQVGTEDYSRKGKTIASFRNFFRKEGEKQNTLQRSCSMKMVQVLWVGFARIWPPWYWTYRTQLSYPPLIFTVTATQKSLKTGLAESPVVDHLNSTASPSE